MKHKLIVILLLPLMMLSGCESEFIANRVEYESDGFRFSYWLEDENGTETTVFYKGNPVIMRYQVQNLSDDTVYYAESFSDAYNYNQTFRTIYRTRDGKEMEPVCILKPDIWYMCNIILPKDKIYGTMNYPESDNCRGLDYLPRGEYHTRFIPKFGYYKVSCDSLERGHLDEWENRIDVNVPEMRIDFTVK